MKKIVITCLLIIFSLTCFACGKTETPQIKLSNDNLTVLSGTSGTVSLSTNLAGDIVWESSNSQLVEVISNSDDDRFATIKAKKSGTAIITASQNGQTVTCSVKVVDLALQCENGAEIILNLTDKVTEELKVKTNFIDGKVISYSCLDKTVADIYGGNIVKAKGVGVTKVIALHPSGLSIEITIRVIDEN